jgi:hypothetical protein
MTDYGRNKIIAVAERIPHPGAIDQAIITVVSIPMSCAIINMWCGTIHALAGEGVANADL